MSDILTRGLVDYLTPEAAQGRRDLIAIGVDPDLALAILEVKMPDTWIYEIATEDNRERITFHVE